jgi:hypothetical protein
MTSEEARARWICCPMCDKKKCEYISYSKVKNYGEITKEVQSRKVK